MSAQQLAIRPETSPVVLERTSGDYATLVIADQMFGIPVLEVRDVLGPQNIAPVPLAPPEIAGALNLRGRIVTAIDMRIRLNLPPRADGSKGMSVVVDYNGELYSLIVDRVGEVMSLPSADFEKNPPTLHQNWREVSDGIYRLDQQLLIVLDISRLLRMDRIAA